MGQQYMTTTEVAQVLRVQPETVRWWRHLGDGRGPRSFKVGRRVLYAVEDVEAFIAAARTTEGLAAGGRVG